MATPPNRLPDAIQRAAEEARKRAEEQARQQQQAEDTDSNQAAQQPPERVQDQIDRRRDAGSSGGGSDTSGGTGGGSAGGGFAPAPDVDPVVPDPDPAPAPEPAPDPEPSQPTGGGGVGGGFTPSPVVDPVSPDTGGAEGGSGGSGGRGSTDTSGSAGGSTAPPADTGTGGGGSPPSTDSGSSQPADSAADTSDATAGETRQRNEQIIDELSGIRTAQQQEKARAQQEAREEFRQDVLPDFNRRVIDELSGIRTTQQREKMAARAPDVEVTEPDLAQLNESQQDTSGLFGGVRNLFGGADDITTRTQSTAAVAPGTGSADDLVEATRPGEESNIDFDQDITDDLTRGGVLPEKDGGALTLGLDEEDFRSTAEDISEFKGSLVGGEPATIAGSEVPGKAVQGLVGVPIELGATVAQAPAFADTGVEIATQAPGEIQKEGVGDVAGALGRVGLITAQETVRSFREEPVRTTAGLVGGVAVSAGTGAVAGRLGRLLRDRVRTLGGEKVPLDELTSEKVAEYYQSGGESGERFPGTEDPDLYQSDPAEAVRQQADQPEAVQDLFADDGTVLTKALGVEPEGPGRGRAGQGLQSAPGESLEEFDYETPGSFVGPDISPNFLGIEDRSRFSLRPGLPDLGSQPTGLFVRTDVKNPDAGTLDEFNEEMIDRAGETDAVTKPADEVNPGEIEAVVPPGAEFADVGGGAVRNTLRRLGIGSDLYTEVQGRRVPLRGVIPESEADTATPPRRFGFDDRGQADLPSGGDTGPAFTGTLDELGGAGRRGTDRPLPVVPAGGGGAGGESPADTTIPAASDELDTGPIPVVDDEPTDPTVIPGVDETVEDPTIPTGPSDDESALPASGDDERGPPGGVPSDPSPIPSGGSGSPGESGIPSDPTSPFDPGRPSEPSGPYDSGTPPYDPSSPPGEPTSPIVPDTPTDRSRRPDFDLDLNGDEDDEDSLFGGTEDPVFTSFLDPLTGNVLETTGSDDTAPGFDDLFGESGR